MDSSRAVPACCRQGREGTIPVAAWRKPESTSSSFRRRPESSGVFKTFPQRGNDNQRDYSTRYPANSAIPSPPGLLSWIPAFAGMTTKLRNYLFALSGSLYRAGHVRAAWPACPAAAFNGLRLDPARAARALGGAYQGGPARAVRGRHPEARGTPAAAARAAGAGTRRALYRGRERRAGGRSPVRIGARRPDQCRYSPGHQRPDHHERGAANPAATPATDGPAGGFALPLRGRQPDHRQRHALSAQLPDRLRQYVAPDEQR